MDSKTLRPRPTVLTIRGRIQWSADLLEWVEAAISAGRTPNEVAAEIGCHPKRVYACLHARRPYAGVAANIEPMDDFAALMGGRRFEDVQLAAPAPAPSAAPVGPFVRFVPRRPVGRALDLGGV